MKKLLILIISLWAANAYAQFPVTQTLGSPTTIVKSRGGFKADVGFINSTYTDTAAANLSAYLKFYSGAQIFTTSDNTVWYRNATATGWIKYAAGTIVSAWALTGNTGTNSAINFLGTTDNVDVIFKRNGVFAGRLGTGFQAEGNGFNTSFGTNSQSSNAGNNNAAFGDNAMSVTTSSFNAAFGSSALRLNTTGGNNTAFGYNSLGANITSANNTAIGYNSLGITTGGNNVGLGGNSGQYNTTASNQIFINSLNRTNYTGDQTFSPLYIQQDATIALQSITLNGKVKINDGTQGLNKVFTSDANGIGSWATPASSGISSLSAIGSTPNANGATITGSVLNLEPASASFGGVVTNGTQTFAGSKNIISGDNNQFTTLELQPLNQTQSIRIGYAGLSYTFSSFLIVPNGVSTGLSLSSSGIGMGINTPAPSAALDVVSTTKGFLMPRMTTVQRDAIASPAVGLQIFNTTTNTVDYYNGIWQSLYVSQGKVSGLLNTALGFEALNSASISGNQNTAIGYQALKANTSGFNNSAFGLAALTSNTSGTENVANGYSSLLLNTTGNQNTAVGRGALFSNITGSENTAIGRFALFTNEGAGRNTAVGNNAGFKTNAAVSTYNTYLGFFAGYENTTGANNIAIGGNAAGGKSTYATNSNKLYIAADTVGINLIHGDLSTGQVQINAAVTPVLTASAALEVISTTRGFLPPRMTTAQRDLIGTPVAGLQIYNTTTNKPNYWNGTIWAENLPISDTAAMLSQYYRDVAGITNGFRLIKGNGNADSIVISYSIPKGSGDNYASLAIGDSVLGRNTTGVQNTGMGDSSFLFNTTGSYNSAYGVEALNKNTTGNYATAIGWRSLYNNTTGDGYNTAVGYRSLFSNTTGLANNAFGGEALFSSNTTHHNNGFGYQALYANTGTQNSGFGGNALHNGTSGSGNTALGYNAMGTGVNTGDKNTSIGYEALKINTSGAENNAFGWLALGGNTTGSYNIGIGTSALQGNTSGILNIGIGYNALLNKSTGDYAVAVGHQAGQYIADGVTAMTVANKSVFIGYKARPNGNSQTNQVVIGGDDVVGLGSNTTVIGNTATVATKLYGITALTKGADVASAAAIVPTGNIFHVSGTTNITSITATNVNEGATMTLIFDGILTFTDGSNLKLAGNFTTAANATITLVYDGTNFYETARSTN